MTLTTQKEKQAMRETTTDRGFQLVKHTVYTSPEGEDTRLVQQSSAIGDYDDSSQRPGTSYLWIGENIHLNREEVKQLRDHLTHWLKTGKLF